jgi:hypothetical protein
MTQLAEIRQLLPLVPEGRGYGSWRRKNSIQLEDLYSLVYGHLASSDSLRDEFLQAELRITAAFLLVKHLDDCRQFADEIIFYQRDRKQISKTVLVKAPPGGAGCSGYCR